MSRSGSTRGQGRIHPHQRNADFSGELLGEDIDHDERYVSNVHATEQHSINYKTKRAHRNKLKQMYEFWQENFPCYYEIGVRALSEEELIDSTNF